MPILLSTKFISYGIQNITTNWTKIIFIFIVIILLAIIFFLIGWKLKQKNVSNQIHNIDNNQKLVASIIEANPTNINDQHKNIDRYNN